MKKVFGLYLSILVGVWFALTLIDRGDYAVERKLWSINQKYKGQAKNSNVPVKTLDEIANEYAKIIREYKSSKAVSSVYLMLGQVYVIKKDFVQARKILEEVPKLYPDFRELGAQAIALIAKTYELEDNWPQAKAIYQKIIQDYSHTPTGLTTPLYIANYYQTKNDFRNTMSSYSQAVDFYKDLIVRNKNSAIEFESLRYLANCYVAQNRWAEAVDTLKTVLIKYPKPEFLTVQRAELIIKTINMITIDQLKDYDLGIRVYQEFIHKYPGHPLNKTLKPMVVRLEKLKQSQQTKT